MRYFFVRYRKYLSLIKALFYKNRIVYLLFGYISFKTKKAYALGYPSLVQIEPTNRCNLQCRLCPTGQKLLSRPVADMTFEQFKIIVEELGKYLSYLVLYVAGEPLLNKDIFKMIKHAKAKFIYIRFSTNATNDCFERNSGIKELINSGIDELIIALDCVDRESYRQYKGNDGFLSVIENIRHIIEERGKRPSPFIHLQLIVTKRNENRLHEFIRLGENLKVDNILFKTVCVNLYGFKDKRSYLPSKKKYIRKVYLEDNLSSCYKPWISTTILSDGSIVPCCFDMNADFKFGNIFEEKFPKIWKSSNYAKFRGEILKDLNSINLCKGCPGKNIPQNFIKAINF